MTSQNPEIPNPLPPEVQAFFDKKNAGYAAIADEAAMRVADASSRAEGEALGLPAPDDRTTSSSVLSGEVADAHVPRDESTIRFADYDRNELLAEFQQQGDKEKIIRLQAANKALRDMVDEIEALGGFKELKTTVGKLDGKRLIYKTVRQSNERLFGAIWKTGKIDTDRFKADETFIEYHDVLVAAESLRDILRARHSVEQEAPKTPEALEALIPELQERIRIGVTDWDAIRAHVSRDQWEEFSKMVVAKMNIVGIPHVNRIAAEFIQQTPDHQWKGEEAREDIERMLRFSDTLEQLVAAARVVIGELKQQSTEDDSKTPTAPPVTREPVSPTLPQTAADEWQRKQLERNAERLEALEKIRAHFQELYNDFQLSEDRPTNRRSYDRYGAGDKAEAGKMVLPPLDEDDGVVANPRELLKQSIHDIYAEFLLAATPEKLQESADGKGVEGKRRFEAYKNRLMNLYNRLWAQIEAAREVGRKQSNIPTDQSNQFGRDSRGVGAAIAKPVDVEIPKVLSPEALERQREIVAELKQKKEYWISRIQACSDKKTFDDITSEGDRISDAWTDCPEFIVGKPFFRLLKERRISDQQEIQAIKNIAWSLQTEVKVAYLAKRDIFYPPRTADTRGTKPVAVEAPKQETPAQLTPEQMRKFLGGVLKGARKELFLSNARLENLNLDSAKHRLALEHIFLEDILPVIIEEIEKKMPLNKVLREQFIKSLKKLLDEV